jgi:hypothetical protein
MTQYKIVIEDRNYTSWNYFNANNFQKIEGLNINPIVNKFFNNDIFIVNKLNEPTILHSSIRSGGPIPAVLILKDNKTYGRKNGKLLYKCIPDDIRIPAFLVPYEIKSMGFSKVFNNIYVTISFIDWNDKHPHAILNQNIGPVDILDNFYEYQLYCKSLNTSIQKFTKDTSKALKTKTHDVFIENVKKQFPSIQDRTNKNDWTIFSIDGPKTVDFDDAFSINDLNDDSILLSIYISNVTIWIDVLNIWDSFSRRISTIYLPDRKRPMLPTILSDCLCSLQSNHTRIAFVMDIYVNKNTYTITDVKYSNCMIRVFKNYIYEEPELLNNYKYNQLFMVTQELSKKYQYISNVRNSNDMVSYLMILMNYNCAKEMIKHNNGIFRSSIIKNEISIINTVPEDVAKFIKIWNSSCGQYIDGNQIDLNKSIKHELLEVDAYIHITSPIRRLVDLLNIIKFQQNLGIITLSDNAVIFYNKWIRELEYINVTMRSIRKVQGDCSMLELCMNNPQTMEKVYDGYCFDKLERNDGLFQFIIFLPELKLMSRITTRENLNNFDKRSYKLFLFNDEEKFKKKIRLQLLQ